MKYDLICVIDDQNSGFFKSEEILMALGERLVFKDVTRHSNGETNIDMSLAFPVKKVLLTGRVMESPNDFVMNMMFAIDACKRQGIEVIDLFIPCLPYARQDRLNGRSVSITSKVMLNMFENIGVNKIYVMDLHSTQMEGFTNISLENIDSMPMLIDSVKDRMRRLGGEFVIVSPDAGGVKRAKKYADNLGLSIAIIHKQRDPFTGESISFSVVGDVEGRHCVIVDDMVDTGGTLVDAERMLKEEGAVTVAFSIGHPVLSKPRNELRDLDLTVLNTVPWTPDDFVIKQVENYFLENILGVTL